MIEQDEMRARVAGRVVRAFEERARELGVGTDRDFQLRGKQMKVGVWNVVIRGAAPEFPLTWEAPQFRFRYTTKALSLEQNVRSPDNPTLCRKLLTRELGLKQFASMKPHEMWPEKWVDAFESVARIQLAKAGYAEDHADGAATCSKCKSKKTSYVSMQTRSADEPTTLFFACHDCGKRWKQ